MNFKNTYISNFEGAFRGLRNPLESWHKSDSEFGIANFNDYNYLYWEIATTHSDKKYSYGSEYDKWKEATDSFTDWLLKNGILKCFPGGAYEYAYIGANDLDLAHRMILAGTSDSKFLRQIFVSVDITAPLYWWKEMDQYKVGTVTNSTSTMHKLASTPITMDCFETDDMVDVVIEDSEDPTFVVTSQYAAFTFIDWLEKLRQKYNKTKDKKYWKELIRWLPESWLQTRTVTMNYAVLRNIYFQRKNHKLTEWHEFCDWIKTLPYAEDLIIYQKEKI